MIAGVKEEREHYVLEVLFYQTVRQSVTFEGFESGIVYIDKFQFEAKGLKKGSVVRLLTQPTKFKGTVLV